MDWPIDFEGWLREVPRGSVESEASIPEPSRHWLEDLYRREGAISRPQLEDPERDATRTAAAAALVSVLDDAEQALGHRPVMEVLDDDGSLRIDYLTDRALNSGLPKGC
jgi:hypothetical protein